MILCILKRYPSTSSVRVGKMLLSNDMEETNYLSNFTKLSNFSELGCSLNVIRPGTVARNCMEHTDSTAIERDTSHKNAPLLRVVCKFTIHMMVTGSLKKQF